MLKNELNPITSFTFGINENLLNRVMRGQDCHAFEKRVCIKAASRLAGVVDSLSCAGAAGGGPFEP